VPTSDTGLLTSAQAAEVSGHNSATVPAEKIITHDGEAFKNDEEAQTAAEAWCALPENSGWIYKGKHGVKDIFKSWYEVVLRNSEPIPTQLEPTAEPTATDNKPTDTPVVDEEQKAEEVVPQAEVEDYSSVP